MIFSTRQTTTIPASAAEARRFIPDELAIGRTSLRIGSAAPVGVWSVGRTCGRAVLEVSPIASDETALTLVLTSPDDGSRFAWPGIRLRRHAKRLLGAITREIGLHIETDTDPVRARRVPAERVPTE